LEELIIDGLVRWWLLCFITRFTNRVSICFIVIKWNYALHL